jgi:hypothetical protein
MFWRAFVAMVTADAIDRHRREQQYRTWAAARAVAANAPRRPMFAPPANPAYDLTRPERPA